MTIAMIADVPPGTSVPGLPAGKQWAKTDLGDYVEIEKAVLRVRDGCLSVVGGGEGAGADGGRSGREKEGEGGGRRSVGFVNPTGYETAGMNGAIGVFLWDTNSAMNRLVKEKIGIGVGNLPGVVAS